MSELGKWPRLLVAGERVTEQQANDILIRTTAFLLCNDRAWMREVGEALGIPLDRHGRPQWAREQEVFQELGQLDLHYLHNARIMSSWVGGPHGWCDWDGTIGCSTHHIGTWPSRETVEEDLALIAATWPFLRMDVQLLADDEDEGDVAAMWQVVDGRAVFVEPGPRLPAHKLTAFQVLQRHMIGGERGLPIDRLQQAIAQVRQTAAKESTR